MKLARFVLSAAALTFLAACAGSPTSADIRAKGLPRADEIVAPLPTDEVVDAAEEGAGLTDDASTPCRGETVTVTHENGTTTTVCRTTQLGSGA
ncbi:MAG TPA: hypothetical protein VFQ45_14140 [Longimicrobium sp.]|nr:hypothetical protein [Longimicrobium sp.]